MTRLRIKVVALLALGLVGLAAGLAVAEGQKSSPTQTHATTSASSTPASTEAPALPSNGTRPAPIVFRPPALSRATQVPLLIALHPTGDLPQDWRTETRYNRLAANFGFVVAYLGSLPAYGKRPGNGPAWRKVDLARNLAYVESEIKSLTTSENIDPKRVYVMGFSAGAYMAYFVGCRLSSLVSGIAAVSGGQLDNQPCHVTHPITELEIIGTHDLTPIAGKGHTLSVDQLAATWRKFNGCGNVKAQASTDGAVQIQTWAPCQGNTAVGLDVIVGGHHLYPGERYPTPNPADTNFKASRVIWEFFMAHPGN